MVSPNLEGRCGTCGWYKQLREREDGIGEGECRLGRGFSPLKATSTCSNHKPRGESFRGSLKRVAPKGSPRSLQQEWREERPRIPKEVGIDMDQDEFREVLREILLDELGVRDVEIGQRWSGGELLLKPGKEDTQSKSVPLDVFFRKIVMVRDKLRVLEQKINASPNLADDEKVQLQQYITGCYGSLTTFKILFKDKDDQFSGQKS